LLQSLSKKCLIDGSEDRKQLWEIAKTRDEQKARLKIAYSTSLIYGAVLLKTYLSAEKSIDSTLSMEDLYRNALRRYNGDPNEKENYQKNIIDSATNDFVTPRDAVDQSSGTYD
jgi:hypothetical protein